MPIMFNVPDIIKLSMVKIKTIDIMDIPPINPNGPNFNPNIITGKKKTINQTTSTTLNVN